MTILTSTFDEYIRREELESNPGWHTARDMHPLDTEGRAEALKKEHGIGLCNITKCCTTVCPEHITITDNAIIPLKERVVDRYYDPIFWLWRKIFGVKKP